jgi:heme/copper-type cytochrome/quinol oxidase subunit 1
MHGVAMIFFFLVPSIPAVLGNFLIPLMIGAKDLAFPKLNLLSWYLNIIGGCFVLYSFSTGGLDTGWTFTRLSAASIRILLLRPPLSASLLTDFRRSSRASTF